MICSTSFNNIVPIYAQGIHVMDSLGNVVLVIVFDYVDKNMYYAKLIKRGGDDLINELKDVMNNMQRFLDQEVIEINGHRTRPFVQDVHLGFRGSPRRPYLEFYVTFSGPLREGVNRYDNWYEEEIAEYDYEILWVFPKSSRVVDYSIAGRGLILGQGNILLVHVSRGTKVGAHEWIEFELKR